jgi:NAD(P)-dependent dehydrogenase (short-subunit alcohol dehydrogenase family)
MAETGTGASEDMTGRVVLITGATSGIGEATARALARRGAHVVLAGRDRDRCEATAEAIRGESGRADGVEYLLSDLSRRDEVRRLADEFRARHGRLDVLVNNAGVVLMERGETADGIERTWAINHLAYFLLTNRLLDVLKASAPARVVCVSSDAHRAIQGLNWDDLEFRKGYRGFKAYCQSKLANVLFTRELARRLEGSGVTANALHPGLVNTRIFRGPGALRVVFRAMANLFGKTAEDGAKTSIYLAGSPEVAGVTGRYFDRCREVEPSKAAQDDEAARRLWEVSERMTGG